MNATIGTKHDDGKDDWTLLPLGPIRSVIRVLMFGARIYGRDNWQHVPMAEQRYYNAAMRHLTAWKDGDHVDPESGLPHLAHAVCCVLFLQWFEEKR